MVDGYPWVQMLPRAFSNLDEIYAGEKVQPLIVSQTLYMISFDVCVKSLFNIVCLQLRVTV
jgi:hypothetical protein